MTNRPVVVVGGGIAGLGAAWELSLQGHDVTVLERDVPGAGATGASAGMLAPIAEARWGESQLADLGMQSLAMWPDWAAKLEHASGVSIDYRNFGTLIVAVDRNHVDKLNHIHALHNQLGLQAEMIDAAQARAMEPALSPRMSSAVWCPNDHQVDPQSLVEALVVAIQRAGGRVVSGAEAEFESHGSRLVCRCATYAPPPDASLVLACGSWTNELGLDAPTVRPIRGQTLALDMTDQPLCQRVVRSPDAYCVPRSDGRLIVGATMEEVGFDTRNTAGAIMDLLVGAYEAIPGVYDLPIVDVWSGLRPVTPDNHPVMRRSEQFDNVVWATGYGRSGILLAPLSARTIACETLAC